MTDLPPDQYPPLPDAPPEDPPISGEGLLETALSVISNPVATLRRVTDQARLGWAVIVVVGVALLTGFSTGATLGGTPIPADPSFPGGGLPAGLGAVLGVMMAVLTPIFALIWLLIVTAILHGSSLLLKGAGSFRGLFCGLAFAQVPSVLNIPAQLLPLGLGAAGFVLSILITIGIGIWVLVLGVVAVREDNHFSTGRAVAAVLIPVAVLAVLSFVLVLMLVLLAAGTFLEIVP